MYSVGSNWVKKYWYGPIKAKQIIPECSAVNVQLFPLEKSSSSPEETCQSNSKSLVDSKIIIQL